LVSKLIEQPLPTLCQAPPTAGTIGVGKGVRLECVKSPERPSDVPAEELLDIEDEGLLVSYLRSGGLGGSQ
jgi:hypothetical protein